MTTINSVTTQDYHYWDTAKSTVIENENRLIFTVINNAFNIAHEVATKLLAQVAAPLKSKFQITNEFILRLLVPSIKYFLLSEATLSSKSIDKVVKFFYETGFSSCCFLNPHLTRNQETDDAIEGITTRLADAYLENNYEFKRIPLSTPAEKKLSCFSYVIKKSGLNYAEFRLFLRLAKQSKRPVPNTAFISFLKFKKMGLANLPLQPGDILVYFDEKDEVTHAALVAENPQYVYAKLGDDAPCAYKHKVDATPIYYGKKFRIFREKPLP